MDNTGWISVKDKLPEHGKVVLVLGSTYDINYNDGYVIGFWLDYQDGTSEWCAGKQRETIDDVTHWMPLPEKPTNSTLPPDPDYRGT